MMFQDSKLQVNFQDKNRETPLHRLFAKYDDNLTGQVFIYLTTLTC